MPGMGRSKYWWDKYEAARASGSSKKDAAVSSSIAEKKHKAKKRKGSR